MTKAPNISLIREAKPKDVGIILGFIRKKAAFDGVPDWVEATEEKLHSELFGPQPRAFVLRGNSGTNRWLRDLFSDVLLVHGPAGIWLDDLFVDESARGQGAGKALLAYLAKLADDSGMAAWSG